MSRIVSNNGIGALYGTFEVDRTSEIPDLTPTDAGKAVALSGNNEVDFGVNAGLLLGRLEHVSEGIATVQLAGVARLPYVTPAPDIGDAVVVNGNGAVKKAGVSEPARGIVLAVSITNSTCDVLL